MGRPPKVKKEEVLVSDAKIEETPKEEVKAKISDIILVRTNKYIASKLVEDKAIVKHISGEGSTSNPKLWYIETSIASLEKLTEEEQNMVSKTDYAEINQRIGHSIVVKNQDKLNSNAQKTKKGAPIKPSEVY